MSGSKAQCGFVCGESPYWRSINNKSQPCSCTDHIAALGAAGGLSPVILAHTDFEERFNRALVIVPSSEDIKETEYTEQRGRGAEGRGHGKRERERAKGRLHVRAAVAQK